MINLSIIVPCLNEEISLEESILNIIEACTLCSLTFEIIIVDDNSSDSSLIIADLLKIKYQNITVIKNNSSLGLGGAFSRGVEVANGMHITWVPGDNSHPASGLIEAYSMIGQSDIILSMPTNPEIRPIVRRLISSLYTLILNYITKLNVPYYNGLNIYRYEILKKMNLNNNSFGFQAEVLVDAIFDGYSYTTARTIITERQIGKSRAFKITNIVLVIKTIYDIFKKKVKLKYDQKNILFK